LRTSDQHQVLGLVQDDRSTVAIKENFSMFSKVQEPGCHLLPWCIGQQIAGYLFLLVHQLDVRCETKTKVFSIPLYLMSDLFFAEAIPCPSNNSAKL
jgi:hypothetical protein